MKYRGKCSIVDRIRKTRQRAGLTAKQLAKKASLSPTTVQVIENGGDYRSSNLRALANALGYSVAELWHKVLPPFEVTIDKKLEPDSKSKLRSA